MITRILIIAGPALLMIAGVSFAQDATESVSPTRATVPSSSRSVPRRSLPLLSITQRRRKFQLHGRFGAAVCAAGLE